MNYQEIIEANNEIYILAKANIDEAIERLESTHVGTNRVLWRKIEAILNDLAGARFDIDDL